ncbi:hypothetical protein LX32DRAFT_235942 [Colletotrichum zoysiae]|uniref:Uncharacterized protein n=1 Tax=Colletotrichum zoysiae TaxID=1216348 RepID=A0AAD9HN39_9PEZI|nr:hypothetical protein LX32DRAFT_235942 [Colletotrichum zoysiae]
MYPTYPVLIVLWSLLSCTSVAAKGPAQETKRPEWGPARAKGLRSDTDIYTVKTFGSIYEIFSPYYSEKVVPVADVRFPTRSGEQDQIIVAEASNAHEEPHPGKIHLSDMIQALASTRYANRPLKSVNWVMARDVIHQPTIDAITSYYKHKPGASLPEKLTIKPSDPLWPALEATALYKTVRWTFKDIKTIKSISIVTKAPHNKFRGANIWCQLKNS